MIGVVLNGGYGFGRSLFEDFKMDYSYGWDSEGLVSGECKIVKGIVVNVEFFSFVIKVLILFLIFIMLIFL